MREITVRELGGEIHAELSMSVRFRRNELATQLQQIDEFDFNAFSAFVDLAMSVLARHCNEVIINDSDLPIEALARIPFEQ